jgi:xylulokinase
LGHINLNTHSKAHICRAALEGIAFSFVYGIELLKKDGVSLGDIRAGNDNLFRSDIFSETIATLIDQPIEIYNTTGAIGAARACNISLGKLDSLGEQIMNHDFEKRYVPTSNKKIYREAYDRWQKELKFILKK